MSRGGGVVLDTTFMDYACIRNKTLLLINTGNTGNTGTSLTGRDVEDIMRSLIVFY